MVGYCSKHSEHRVDLQLLAHSKFNVNDGQMASLELEKKKDNSAAPSSANSSDESGAPTQLNLLPTIAQGDVMRLDIRTLLPPPETGSKGAAAEPAWIKTMIRDGSTIVVSFIRHQRMTTVNQIAVNLSARWRDQLMRGERGVVQPEEWIVLIRPTIAVAVQPAQLHESRLDSNTLPEPPSEPAHVSAHTERQPVMQPLEDEPKVEPKSGIAEKSANTRRDSRLAQTSWSGSNVNEAEQIASAAKTSRANGRRLSSKIQEMLDQGAIAPGSR